jgi:hypothetical protein
MMAVARPAGLPQDGTQVPAGRQQGSTRQSDPVIVLASAHSGTSRLFSLLTHHPDLACTSGTGLLPLCEQVVATWRTIDGRAGLPSPLAVASARALATSIITSVLAREGKRRWCEAAIANSQVAETFLRLYPGARFMCLYRACPGAIRAVLDASPWGIADPAFAPFIRAYPASTVAALAAHWVAHTGTLLAFERAHPEACLRVRYEDLAEARHETGERIRSFLGLAGIRGQPMPGEASQSYPPPENLSPEADLPVDLIPPMMLAQANDLLRELGYPELGA